MRHRVARALIDLILPGGRAVLWWVQKEAEWKSFFKPHWLTMAESFSEDALEDNTSFKSRVTSLFKNGTITEFSENDLSRLVSTLDDEHNRLDGLEAKARVGAGSAGFLIGISSLVLRNSKIFDGDELLATLGQYLVLFGIMYVALALLFGASALQVSARWYLTEADLKVARAAAGEQKDRALAAACLAGRALMVETSQFKQNWAAAAVENLRNALVLLAGAILLAISRSIGLS